MNYEKKGKERRMKEFISEYASVKYVEADNVVFLVWKNPAYLENYRNPTTFALELLRKHEGSNFVIDARNGFEDDKRDVEWGFSYLLPEMASTSCKFVSFIMNEVNEIEAEMDMWTIEFGKYFAVTRAENYEEAIHSIHSNIFANVRYTIKSGKRDAFLKEMAEAKIMEASRREPGNIQYEICVPQDSSDEVCLIELWTNQTEQKRHATTPHYATLTKLKSTYVEKVDISCYKVEKI